VQRFQQSQVKCAIRFQEALEITATRSKPTDFDELRARGLVGRSDMPA
jgi:hypothetical protein